MSDRPEQSGFVVGSLRRVHKCVTHVLLGVYRILPPTYVYSDGKGALGKNKGGDTSLLSKSALRLVAERT